MMGQPASSLVLSVMYKGATPQTSPHFPLAPEEGGSPVLAAYVTLPGGLAPPVLQMLVRSFTHAVAMSPPAYPTFMDGL